MAQAFRDQTKALANLSMIEQRLTRQFEKALKQLRELQTERRGRESWQMTQAVQLLEMRQDQKLPYQPQEDGFVFSTEEIEQHIRRAERLDDARDAHYARNAAA